ncbi:interleukin-36 alpha-like isoform X1 [Ahaetulla prasina]|uniref:interleukin-36 alpha-like isoform X1 n=1 Tax=Ahaetulla prasina TaxID=499056 RepID=UPI0026473A2D|nr:interleukin-36 alpha-like isoform X1 [Ahaetulla prasina]XP_058050130.1 interleukin-36 alpha-like isoform X1 [Ahaetulla prasina]XP_058050131.1 interleukin-36 alpha-like isoform X1 [Ahaetulla prasina]XP_058050132.1 interleukin-36 alpha-like isoform X1 [Ahaetulla prasina]XP_058050133.1 interleukin-36 alpha-like isoform X1 [Ahaetulla prasina]
MEPQKKTVDEEMKDLFREFKDKETVKDPWNFRMWDIEHKYFFYENNDLIAAPLDSRTPEQLMAVVPNDNLDFRNRPIFMGLTGKTKVLSCLKSTNDEPQLVILEKDIMDLYRDTKEFKNFSFYVITKGSLSTCCFESAAFPGWFLSTSIQPNMQVGLGKLKGPEILLFHFEKVASTPK